MNRFLAHLTQRYSGMAGAAALALCGTLSLAAAQAPAARPPTIAVLPLENNSSDPARISSLAE